MKSGGYLCAPTYLQIYVLNSKHKFMRAPKTPHRIGASVLWIPQRQFDLAIEVKRGLVGEFEDAGALSRRQIAAIIEPTKHVGVHLTSGIFLSPTRVSEFTDVCPKRNE